AALWIDKDLTIGNSLIGGIGDDTIIGTGGNDIISGGKGNDTLSGGEGRDELTGGEGNDTLTGGGGSDTLTGGDGDDILRDSGDGDNLNGGAGNDIFDINLSTSSKYATSAFIGDFTPGEDKIDLKDLFNLDASTIAANLNHYIFAVSSTGSNPYTLLLLNKEGDASNAMTSLSQGYQYADTNLQIFSDTNTNDLISMFNNTDLSEYIL
ncbi:MAG: type I secretion C-terminal target domain-containing protein, partial [Gammaproteobacteria bacterium]|nr:type I secretion C-terminal target domain-containing protein [Gammaproteobacteria bacterium]